MTQQSPHLRSEHHNKSLGILPIGAALLGLRRKQSFVNSIIPGIPEREHVSCPTSSGAAPTSVVVAVSLCSRRKPGGIRLLVYLKIDASRSPWTSKSTVRLTFELVHHGGALPTTITTRNNSLLLLTLGMLDTRCHCSESPEGGMAFPVVLMPFALSCGRLSLDEVRDAVSARCLEGQFPTPPLLGAPHNRRLPLRI